MRVLITGAQGFIGKNLVSHFSLVEDVEVIELTRQDASAELDQKVKNADFIFHLAGVNRPEDESEFVVGNVDLTEQIIDVLKRESLLTPLVLSSSTQAELDNPYGRSKLAAEEAALQWHKDSSAPVYIYRLPGVFGKWCRPNYNSVVATFCYNISRGLPVVISNPQHLLKLVYVDDVVAEFASLLTSAQLASDEVYGTVATEFLVSLGELESKIEAIRDIRTDLLLPDLSNQFDAYLYATYTSYLDEQDFGYELKKNQDHRGWLAEFVKSSHSGQIFISKTAPGISRGNHWHKTKIEKFLVVSGQADITFRKKTGQQEVLRYEVRGEDMRVIDIPVGYVHAITNTGEDDLVTIFWASEVFDKDRPDTYFEAVTE